MINLKVLAVALALPLTGGSAMAQSWNCIPQGPNGRTCMDEDGNTVTQRRDASGLTTTDEDGNVWRTQRMGAGHSTTYGSDGSVYNTQRVGPNMTNTTDDHGNMWQMRRDAAGLFIIGPNGETRRCQSVGGRFTCY